MIATKPHYLLFCDGNFPANEHSPAAASRTSSSSATQRWRFVLENIDDGNKFEASDRESGAPPDRTALMAVLRGLEALDQPSRVTLVTTSRYVFRGLQYGLNEWRENDYSWEHFGSVQPIRNADLWKRIDRTLAYHQVQCRWMSQEEHVPTALDATAPNDIEPTPVEAIATQEAEALHSQHSEKPTLIGNANSSEKDSLLNPALCSDEEKSASSSHLPDDRVDDGNKIGLVAPTLSDVLVAIEATSEQFIQCSGYRNTTTTPLSVTVRTTTPIFKDSGPTRDSSPAQHETEGRSIESVDSDALASGTAFVETDSPTKVGLLAKTKKVLFTPIRWASRGWNVCWEAILRLDDLAESYVRCFFLLDPKTRRPR